MFIYLKDNGQDRWINTGQIIYFNGDHLWMVGDKMITIDKEYRSGVKSALQGLIIKQGE